MDNGQTTALVQRNATTALEPTTISETMELAGYLVASGMLKGINKREAALAVILTGRELGMTAMQSLRSIHVIEGRPTLSADLMAALVKRSPACKFFRLVQSTEKVATYETMREGDPEPTRMSFTIEQAQRAGVTGKDNWKKYPEAMLRARCIAALARAVYPDLLAGVYETDEIVTQQPARVATAEVVESYEETDDEKINRWMAAMEKAESEEALTRVGKAIKAEAMPETVRAKLAEIYKSHRNDLKRPPVVTQEAVTDAEVTP